MSIILINYKVKNYKISKNIILKDDGEVEEYTFDILNQGFLAYRGNI